MRFRFCWECDCPDWLLAEMLTLSKISSAELRHLTSAVVSSILGEPLNLDQALSSTSAALDKSGTEAAIAAVRWILESSTGSDTEPHILDSELQQLGLPKDHSAIIREVYTRSREELKKTFKEQSLKASGKVHWSYDLRGIDLGFYQEPVVQLNLQGQILDQNICLNKRENGASRDKVQIHMLPDQLDALLYELSCGYEEMKELKNGHAQ